ncbi:hypothetical protein FNO01nite_05090 [Flavobacterium noncentrifugens]|uniref:Helix-turn-helix n=1 Tax=Flavobacterium noncentrifugens TaxID=1128970 RepID=A0A1G8SHQ1_9FLAO|nr:helix-turn-helix transcriptional regulator [Flavobacterium noncentrifugens]GEP49837.1 hypothetical protein FNO01nite_05090 [Flavobacterium noncentrifugens]SDJ28772.1 Helix-turn-helix [Flavobacterium noncentrifugens]
MIIEIITSEIDFGVMEKIRNARIKAGIDQVELAQRVGVSEGYIGNLENPKIDAKVNIRMLGRIAIALEQNSYNDLLPDEVKSHDLVIKRIRLIETNSRKHVLNDDGEVPKRLDVLETTPITEDELKQMKDNKDYKYCRIIEE